MKEMFCIFIKISLKFVPKGPIDNNRALVQILSWRRIGDKPLSEPMLIRFIYAAIGGDELSKRQPLREKNKKKMLQVATER